MLLAGDIGATKSTLAVVSAARGPRDPLVEATVASHDYPDLETLVRAFLARTPAPVDRACLGVAGPVVAGRATITNLPWTIEDGRLQAAASLASVALLNDLEATAWAVPELAADELVTLQPGAPVAGGAIAVIAPGTGLGEAYLVWDGARYRAHPSEGGHGGFAPATPRELELLRFLWQRFEHVSYERVCSGMGLPNLYAYLKASGAAEEPAWLAERLAAADDPTPVIVQAAFDRERPCRLCAAAIELFVAILGTAAGDLALTTLATGGVYLGGGLPPRLLPALRAEGFLHAFRRKGRFAAFLTRTPVHVILNAKAAVLGAAAFGLDLERRAGRDHPGRR